MERSELTVFPDSPDGSSPLALYQSVHGGFTAPRNEIFYSHPITSSGVREFVFTDDSVPVENKVGATITGNNNLARLIVANLRRDSDAKLTLPAQLGARNGWGEFEYNRFWFFYITGVDVESAGKFERMATNSSNSSLFNDYHGSRVERQELYARYVKDYINYVKYVRAPINPVDSIVFLPGSEGSLGCRMERQIAKAFHIPMEHIYIDGPAEFPDTLNLYIHCVNNGILPKPAQRVLK